MIYCTIVYYDIPEYARWAFPTRPRFCCEPGYCVVWAGRPPPEKIMGLRMGRIPQTLHPQRIGFRVLGLGFRIWGRFADFGCKVTQNP